MKKTLAPINLDFARSLLPEKRRRRRGDPLTSTMLGCPSIVLGIVNLAAIFGRAPEGLSHLVKQTEIIPRDAFNPRNYAGPKLIPGWWYVPEAGFWVLAATAVALSACGIVLSSRRGRPYLCSLAFGLNTILVIAGFILAFTDYRQN